MNVHEAKTNLSRLLARVERGEEIVIARDGVPVARLVPVGRAAEERALGADAGEVAIGEEFDAPLPAELLDRFED